MKATVLLIIAAALAAGLWQGQELSRLKQREVELSAAAGKPPGPAGVAATKSPRREAKTRLDGSGFVGLIAKSLGKGVPPSEEELRFFRDQMASASGRELKQWTLALRDSELAEELKSDILRALAPRLAESDPKLAAELVVDGGEGMPFRSVLRTWLAMDAKAAAAWLAAAEPPIKASRFRNLGDLDLPALTIAANVAADPANEEGLVDASGTLSLAILGELAAIQTAGDFANVLQRFSRDSHLPENRRLQVIGGTLSRYRDPAAARQILLDASLPSPQFITTAAIMIQALDPVGRQSAIEWVNRLPDSGQRAELLKAVSPEAGP